MCIPIVMVMAVVRARDMVMARVRLEVGLWVRLRLRLKTQDTGLQLGTRVAKRHRGVQGWGRETEEYRTREEYSCRETHERTNTCVGGDGTRKTTCERHRAAQKGGRIEEFMCERWTTTTYA